MPALSWLNWWMCLWQDAFFGSWAYPKCTLRKPKPNWKNAWFWRAVVWYPAVQLEKTFVLCDYLGCAVEQKGVPCACHFAPVESFGKAFLCLSGKRPLTGLRHEDLLLATRVPPRTSQAQRTHQMAHMMRPTTRSVKMADPLNLWIPWNLSQSGWKRIVNRLVETSRTRSFVAQVRCRLLAPWLPPSCKKRSNPKKSQRDAPEIHGDPDFSEAASRWSFLILSHFGKVGGHIFSVKRLVKILLLREVCFSAAFWTWDSQVMRWPTKIFVEVQRLISLMSQKTIWKDWIQKYLFWLNASKKVFALLGAELL